MNDESPDEVLKEYLHRLEGRGYDDAVEGFFDPHQPHRMEVLVALAASRPGATARRIFDRLTAEIGDRTGVGFWEVRARALCRGSARAPWRAWHQLQTAAFISGCGCYLHHLGHIAVGGRVCRAIVYRSHETHVMPDIDWRAACETPGVPEVVDEDGVAAFP